MRPPTVTVIGCVQADVVMSPVTDLPAPGGTLLTDQMTVRVGGAGANAALASVEAGMEARLIGCIGEDHLGDWMRGQLAPAGLADELVVVPGQASGLTVALESRERDRTFLTYLGVNARWEPAMIPDGALTCDNLLLCDYFVAPRLRGEAARRLLDTARARGGRTFFDTTWDPDGFSEPDAGRSARAAPVGRRVPAQRGRGVRDRRLGGCGWRCRRGGARPSGRLGRVGRGQARTARMHRGRAGRGRAGRAGADRKASPTPPAPATPSTRAWCTRWRAGRTGRTR